MNGPPGSRYFRGAVQCATYKFRDSNLGLRAKQKPVFVPYRFIQEESDSFSPKYDPFFSTMRVFPVRLGIYYPFPFIFTVYRQSCSVRESCDVILK